MSASTLTRICFVPKGPLSGTFTPPGSKSISNRAMICAAMGTEICELHNMLLSEDTEVMINAWRQLGVSVDLNTDSLLCRVTGCGGKLPIERGNIYVANSGTTIRFLTAALAACRGDFTLDGVERMRARPIGDLILALRQLGCNITSRNSVLDDCPPIQLLANKLRGGKVQVAGDVSSQFLSGLMMAAPYADSDVDIEVIGELVSRPYVVMTAAVMGSFGVEVKLQGNRVTIPAPQKYTCRKYVIEPDASAASYYLATAAITGGDVTVAGLGKNSLQGDVQFADVLAQMGCSVDMKADSIRVRGGELRGIEVDMNSISDTVQTLAAVALFAKGSTRVRGVAHNRFKETDRIADLACELRKLGAIVFEFEDGLEITPGKLQGAQIETYHDHRMAMSMSLVGLRQNDVWINDPGCTAKTYPAFFDDMQRCFELDTLRV